MATGAADVDSNDVSAPAPPVMRLVRHGLLSRLGTRKSHTYKSAQEGSTPFVSSGEIKQEPRLPAMMKSEVTVS